MNPVELLKGFITKGMTPKGIAKMMAGNNPMINNLIDLMEKGNSQEVEVFAKNVLKERGLDLDKEMENFKQTLNIR